VNRIPSPVESLSSNTTDAASAPVVSADSFLTLHYRMMGPDGQDIVNTFGGKPSTFSLGSGALSPGVEQRLLGLEEGTHCQIELDPGEAFGDRNPQMVQRVGLKLLREWGDPHAVYTEGDVVQFPVPEGTSASGGASSFTGMVREVGEDWLTIDFNHPLAGQPVTLEVQVIGVL
jgi:FKBP-type peptidyl-prolyl cis-trans isomerase SlpA